MRIIAGEFGSLKIKQVPSSKTRETSDKVRGAVFNSLALKVVDALVLDLFSGSGAYGLEAISRGAKEAHLNDIERIAHQTITENVARLKKPENVTITRIDAKHLLNSFIQNNKKFDLIFVDPPYASDYYETLLENMLSILNEDGVIIYEMHKERSLKISDTIPISIYKESIYGIKKISYLKRIDPINPK